MFANKYKTIRDSWRPLTVRWPVIAVTITFTALLLVAACLLLWIRDLHGAVYVANSNGDLSMMLNLFSQYIPTIIAIFYGTIWGWIDLDLKRVEPWFQLSTVSGVSAKDSILLHYPVDFLAFVPVKAARRGQWTIFSVSMVMVLVSWMITPLLSSIFASTMLTVMNPRSSRVSDGLIDLAQQTQVLNTGFLNTAFSVLWLGQSLPAFTTTNLTVKPLLLPLPQYVSNNNAGTSFTYQTSSYWTELSCTSPEFAAVTDQYYLSFDNGRGCNASDVLSIEDPFRTSNDSFGAYYVGYFNDPRVDYFLQGPGCPLNSSHEFLAVWRRLENQTPNFDNSSDATALFCSAQYFTQTVNATVAAADFSIIQQVPTGPSLPLTDDIFNTTQFEYVLGAGTPPQLWTSSSPTRDISDGTFVYQDVQLSNMSLPLPTTNMVGFAIGASHLSPAEYLDPSKLSKAFNSAHQLLFAIAVQSLMSSSEENASLASISQSADIEAITIVPAIAIAVIVALVLILLLAVYLFAATMWRPCHLASDPNSIAKLMSLSRNVNFRAIFREQSDNSIENLNEELRDRVLRINTADFPTIELVEQKLRSSGQMAGQEAAKKRVHVTCQRGPLELGMVFGTGFAFFLILVTVAISLLYFQVKSANGLPLPTTGIVAQQILLNYIPTTVATLIEPIWVLVIRLICMLQPFYSMRFGAATAQKSLQLTYTASPPQLISWKAFQNGHIFIASLGVLAIMANLLTIAMNGLFYTGVAAVSEPILAQNMYLQNFTSDPFQNESGASGISIDPVYVVMSNISANTTLPAWLGTHQYFMPVQLPSPELQTPAIYQVNTTSIGAKLECQDLSQGSGNATYEYFLSSDATNATLLVRFTQADGMSIECGSLGLAGSGPPYTDVLGTLAKNQAAEIITLMAVMNDTANGTAADFCSEILVYGWLRLGTSFTLNDTTSSVSLNSTFFSCRPQIYAAPSEVIVNSVGVVLSVRSVGQTILASNLSTSMAPITTRVRDISTIRSVYESQIGTYHNDTHASDWPNYLIKLLTNSTGFVDPSTPPPPFPAARDYIEDVYARIWAAQLSIKASFLTTAPSNPANSVTMTKITSQQRIFMSDVMFWIAFTVLILDIVGAAVVYTTLPKPVLPRMPNSIASIAAYFAASHCIEDFVEGGGGEEEEDGDRKRKPDKHSGSLYGYGKVVGTDGLLHTGIDRSTFVTPFEMKRRRWWT